jgi:MYXO-CTERM domain-containing protein
MNIYRILAVTLIAVSLTLVGCGGGGGGSSSGSGSENTSNILPDQNTDIGEVAENDEGVDPSLLLPVGNGSEGDQYADAGNGDNPGYVAANPEPTTAALAALGLAFLATRRYGRRTE